MNRCDTCRFRELTLSDIEDEGVLAWCYRFPPLMVVVDGEMVQVHPAVDETTWCGEYQPDREVLA